MTEPKDYRDTVFLPKTDFPMKAGLPQKEPAILAKWQAEDIYAATRAARAGREKFILHDGPPYANGDMHIGHALNHILKDMVVRTQTLLGKDAPYVPGWDCHGLPIEWKVEELYRKKKLDKDQVPLDEFRAECRAYAANWVNLQREQLKRLGVNGDWDNPYLTMAPEAEGTIVAELLKFAESGQLYRGAKPVMWSPVEKTALAEAEVEYEDIVSTQIDVAFEIVESPIPELVGAHAVIWTTTPWTIPVNQALAYGPDVEYGIYTWGVSAGDGSEASSQAAYRLVVEAQPWLESQSNLVVATGLVPQVEQRLNAAVKHLGVDIALSLDKRPTFKGSDLAGTIARHPMARAFLPPSPSGEGSGEGAVRLAPLSDDSPHPNPRSEARDSERPEGEGLDVSSPLAEFFLRPRPFLPGTFVTTDAGTGLVHMAPDHGEDDFDLCKAHGINPVFSVEADGKYRADWAWLGGQGSVINPKFNAPEGPICTALRDAGGLLAASADFKHSYPHSWRSKAKLIYRCTPQWFVSMDKNLPSRLREGSGEGLSDSAALETAPPLTPPASGRGTLRQTALTAIANTRFVPEKGRNRLGSMVEGRPDWVLSRQRAWGVPITLFVHRQSGEILVDPAVNARIIAAVKADGVDAWSDARAQEYLGDAYAAADYERIADILDVWFDSGCTHAFVLESGKWPDLQSPADLYLEGSDQHRGWFQSSLLESCATRGRAPYKAVLTHGFTMASDGRKMSKSLGNTIDPIKVMETSGADIIRLWALSVDFTEDHRIGDEILKGTADQYRKLRNTFRYMLGALEGFGEDERLIPGTVPLPGLSPLAGTNETGDSPQGAGTVPELPELERYILHRLAALDAELRRAVDDFDFNTYVRALTDFMAEDLSAFYFDIRKDSLYCDIGPAAPLGTDKRRAYRTVLDILFQTLIRYAAPVLVFTAEEVWGTRYPDAGSVHLLEWPVLPDLFPREGGGPLPESATPTDPAMDSRLRGKTELEERWTLLRDLRSLVNERIEPLRRDKVIRSSLEAEIEIDADHDRLKVLHQIGTDELAELFIVANVKLCDVNYDRIDQTSMARVSDVDLAVAVRPTTHNKCGRCWRHLPEVTEDGSLCGRCATVLGE